MPRPKKTESSVKVSKSMNAQPRTFELKITLARVEPEVWRLVRVPESITLDGLHDVIQAAMGWEDDHLFFFEIKGQRYSPLEPGVGLSDYDDRDSDVRLCELVTRPMTKFIYTYDMGDDWVHQLQVMKIVPTPDGEDMPKLLAGAGRCPPEDCGGPYGYDGLLAALANPREDPEQTEYAREVLGPRYKPDAFNIKTARRAFKKVMQAGAYSDRALEVEFDDGPAALGKMDEFLRQALAQFGPEAMDQFLKLIERKAHLLVVWSPKPAAAQGMAPNETMSFLVPLVFRPEPHLFEDAVVANDPGTGEHPALWAPRKAAQEGSPMIGCVVVATDEHRALIGQAGLLPDVEIIVSPLAATFSETLVSAIDEAIANGETGDDIPSLSIPVAGVAGVTGELMGRWYRILFEYFTVAPWRCPPGLLIFGFELGDGRKGALAVSSVSSKQSEIAVFQSKPALLKYWEFIEQIEGQVVPDQLNKVAPN